MGHATQSPGSDDETVPLLRQGDDLAESAVIENPEELRLGENSLTRLRACLIIVLFSLLIFVQTSNVSLMTTISGSIAHDLDAFADVSWFTSAYLIAMSTTTPLAGRFCKIFAPRFYIFFSGMILSIGLLCTSLAQSELIFLLSRVCSGIGAGGCFTVAIIVATEYASSRFQGFFLGLVNTGFTIGVASGAAFSGAIDSVMGWRAIFWLQTPIAIAASSGLLLTIPDGTKVAAGDSWIAKLKRVDYIGAGTFITSIVLLLYSLAATEIHILPIVLSILGFAILLFIESHVAEPIFPLPILKSRGVLLTCVSTLGYMSSRWTVLFYTPVYTIAVREWSRATAGLILIPTNAGFAFGGLIVGWLHIRDASSSFWLACITVYVGFVVTLYVLSLLSTDSSSIAAYIVTTFANGFVTGAALNYVLAHVLRLTPISSHPIVASLVAFSRGLGGSLGSSIGGGVFLRALERSLRAGFEEKGLTGTEDLVRRLLGSPALVQSLVGVEHQVAKSAYEKAIRSLFVAGCLLATSMIPLQAGTGWNTARIEGVEDNDGHDERRL